jgi:hypothetical protein
MRDKRGTTKDCEKGGRNAEGRLYNTETGVSYKTGFFICLTKVENVWYGRTLD